jgi:serine/threonine protein kinase
MKVALEIFEGPYAGKRMEFDRHETLLVGRATTAQLQLTDDLHFSRHHFQLEFNPPRCFLRDLGSSNGTFVNGTRVTECHLRHGDVISGGKTKIRVLTVEEEIQTPWEPPPSEPPVTDLAKMQPTPYVVPDIPPPLTVPLVTNALPEVPGYDLQKLVGTGGMGKVYLARHEATGQMFALKIIAPESASNEKAMNMFLREINVLSRLDHPRIVRFHEMGIAQGRFFFVMEYVDTVDLLRLLDQLNPATKVKVASAVMCQVLEGLSHAHKLAFVHRDIKPANILVSRQGKKLRAKLADFGLAKKFDSAGLSGMTCEGQTLGTLAFMAPEQAINSRDVTPTVDLYSVGASLYYFLTAKVPYNFDSRNPLLVVMEDEPVPIRTHNPHVPEPLADLIHRALQRSPSARFPSADAMRQALLPFAKAEG